MIDKTAEILCVGTEILMGNIVNTNAAYIASKLASLGIGLYYQSVVGDNSDRLEAELKQSLERSDMVITTGGLGPTYDDLTKETVAKPFHKKMARDEKALKQIETLFKKIGREMTENNKKQAMIPEGATVFYNQNGTAPGMAVSDGVKTVILLPGPPKEMIPMMESQVIPYLAKQSGGTIKSRMVHTYGIGESMLETELKDIMVNYTNPTIAPYAKPDEVHVRVSAFAKTEEEADKMLDPVVELLRERCGKYIYGIDIGSLQNALVQKLKEQKKTVATAESCSGGYISKRITEISGSSKVFGLGVCTYCNEAKMKILGVKSETLEKYTAVSEQVAIEMADGVRKLAGADIGLSTTGYAGPEGEDVGLVYVGVSTKDKSFAMECRLGRGYSTDREDIRYKAASRALYLALKELD
ncbi:MAG: competence/damage-inducible protein A [Eubacteriales bacterium]|nr:competence/damage-inducible protein A [Eubacteriales bacterium]